MNHRMQLLCFSVLLCAPALLVAQTRSIDRSSPLAEASPADVGMSAERLARIDAVIDQAIQQRQIPGAVALVARRGKIVYHKAFGTADQQSDRTLDKDAIFRIASQSKAITATAVMMLWEEGHFQLDDPVARWIPEFQNTGVLKTYRDQDVTWTTEPASAPITIRHLLTHTSGIG
jgi:CubicO group peptidase (beta-lactamase class C family)